LVFINNLQKKNRKHRTGEKKYCNRKQSADQREKNSLGLAFFFCRNQRKKKKLEKLQTKTSKDHVIGKKKEKNSVLRFVFTI